MLTPGPTSARASCCVPEGSFEVSKDSPVEDFIAEAHRHPMFELIPLSNDAP
jgi:hypothetical protein